MKKQTRTEQIIRSRIRMYKRMQKGINLDSLYSTNFYEEDIEGKEVIAFTEAIIDELKELIRILRE